MRGREAVLRARLLWTRRRASRGEWCGPNTSLTSVITPSSQSTCSFTPFCRQHDSVRGHGHAWGGLGGRARKHRVLSPVCAGGGTEAIGNADHLQPEGNEAGQGVGPCPAVIARGLYHTGAHCADFADAGQLRPDFGCTTTAANAKPASSARHRPQPRREGPRPTGASRAATRAPAR